MQIHSADRLFGGACGRETGTFAFRALWARRGVLGGRGMDLHKKEVILMILATREKEHIALYCENHTMLKKICDEEVPV